MTIGNGSETLPKQHLQLIITNIYNSQILIPFVTFLTHKYDICGTFYVVYNYKNRRQITSGEAGAIHCHYYPSTLLCMYFGPQVMWTYLSTSISRVWTRKLSIQLNLAHVPSKLEKYKIRTNIHKCPFNSVQVKIREGRNKSDYGGKDL